MKIAIVKDAKDKDIWGPEPIIWESGIKPLDALATFQSRVQAWGLLRDGADLLILNIPAQWYEDRAKSHEDKLKWDKKKTLWPEIMLDNAGFYRLHAKAIATDSLDAVVDHARAEAYPTEDEVHWEKYDVVICTSPWLSKKTIKAFPNTVFAYWNYSATWEYFVSQQRGKPFDSHYDLHLDHIEGPDNIERLPQTVYFPYITNSRVREDFRGIKKTIIATGQRTLDENPEIRNVWPMFSCGRARAEMPPGKYGGKRMNGKEYFQMLNSAKYLVHVRNVWSGSGQKAVEAASLGVVVVGSHYGHSFNRMVHPACKIDTPYRFPARDRGPFGKSGCPWLEVQQILEWLESDDDLYEEVLAYQRVSLDAEYQRCIENLQRAIDLKRGRDD